MALCCPTLALFSLRRPMPMGPGSRCENLPLALSSLRDGDHTLLFTY